LIDFRASCDFQISESRFSSVSTRYGFAILILIDFLSLFWD
jgi:hypothetical protein